MSLPKIHRQNLENIFFSTKQIILRVGGQNIKIILEIKFYFFPTLRKGFVNQLIKEFWPKVVLEWQIGWVAIMSSVIKGDNKVSKGAKTRNRYNQVPHLTKDTNRKVTNSQ